MRDDLPNSKNWPSRIVLARPERARRPAGGLVLFAGVAGACALGVGAGLWARPAPHERQAVRDAPVEVATPATTRKLEIVVDDHPPPVGAPIEVLPGGTRAAFAAPPAPAYAEPVAPKRPPQGLIKAEVEAPPAAEPAPRPPHLLPTLTVALAAAEAAFARLKAPPAPAAEVAVATEPVRESAAERKARRLALAQAAQDSAQAEKARAGKIQAEKVQAAKAEAARNAAQLAQLAEEAEARAAAKAEAHRLALARAHAEKAQFAQAQAQSLAQAQARKADAAKARRTELAREAQTEKAEQLRLAKAQARAKAAQREEARLEALAEAAEAKKRTQLARLAHASQPVHAHDRPTPVVTAKLDRKHGHKAAAHEAKVEQASLKGRKGREAGHPAPHAARARPDAVAPPPASGLMKVSTSPRCASRDAGQALVCADPGLSAAERQLSRAYQGARAAGVPDEELERGQQRWLAARSAAAREAPWAVRDVYMARIAELNGQAREARDRY